MDDMTMNNTWISSEQIDVRYGYYTVCGTILFFQILNKIFAFFGKPEKIHADDFWRWRNLLCSWSHALITGTLTLYSIYAHPEMFDNLLTFTAPLPYTLVAFSTGYFLYDTGDMIMVQELLPNWEVVLHHIAVTSMFFYDTIFCRCIGYNILALLAEVNSLFLHTRKLLQMLKTPFDDRFYRFNNILNLITFAVFRSLSLGSIMYGILQPGERARVSYMYFLSLACSEMVMLLINPILFVRLVKNDLLRKVNDDNSNNIFKNGGNPEGSKRFNLSEN